MIVLLATAAFARDEACVPTSLDALRLDFDSVEVALRDGEVETAASRLAEVTEALPCSTAPAAPWDVARIARLTSLVDWAQGNHEEAARWAGLWRSVDASVGTQVKRYTVPPEWEQATADAKCGASEGPDGKGLAPPKGGLVLVDGAPAARPEATGSCPHLVQVFDRKMNWKAGSWQDGAAFDEEWLGVAGDASVPEWFTTYAASRPPAPEPIVAAPKAPAPAGTGYPRHARSVGAPPVKATPVPAPGGEPIPVPVPAVAPEAAPDAAPEPDPEPAAGPASTVPAPAPEASDCAWGAGQPTDVDVTSRAITIDGHTWPIRTTEDVDVLRTDWRACREFRAVRRFDKWRDARGKLFSSEAREQKEAMVQFLLEPEPERTGRRRKAAE